MDDLLEVITTRDGSRTLYSRQYQQSFHSVHGALTEAHHVFLEGSGTDLVRARIDRMERDSDGIGQHKLR